MKKSIIVLMSVLALAAFVLVGCEDATDNGDTIVQVYKVGDELAGGFVVTYADTLGGYEAERDFDADDDGTVDEYQTIVAGKFGSDRTWTEDRVYYLTQAVFIGNDNSSNCTLTIEAGTLIKGETSTTDPGLLVITRGSKIMAEGTKDEPIVFTSAREVKAPKDWGGLVINGNAPINNGDNGVAQGEGSTGNYGGTNAADNSGVLEYVRVEFAGTLFSPDNELNGITFQGVGNGTKVSHIQVHMNGDDGVEFFGGTVNVDHVVITGAGDDSLDWTYGWVGNAQFVILQQYDGIGDCAIEADSNKSHTDAAPKDPVSDPTLANFTIIKSSNKSDAMKFRRATDATVYNFLVAGSGSSDISDEYSKGLAAGDITFDGVVAAGGVAANDATTEDENNDSADATVDSESWAAAVTAGYAEILADVASLNLPAAAYPAANEGSVSVTPTAAPAGATVTTADLSAVSGLVAANYFGAVEPGTAAGSAWYEGWTSTPAN